MDISETTTPRSDQQNYEDYLGGKTRTVTVSGVTAGSLEQPVNIELEEFPGRPYKPNKTFRRLLVLGWGADSSAYIGRKLTLRGNPEVVFGGKAIGGVEIAAMSHITKPLVAPLTVTRGKRKDFTVLPLAAEPTASTRDWLADLKQAADIDAVAALGVAASAAKANPLTITAIRAEWNRLNTLGNVAVDPADPDYVAGADA